MPVSRADVRQVAALARLGIAEERLEALVGELNGILAHMDVLQQVETSEIARAASKEPGMSLRADEESSVALARAREDFAPHMRDGFFLVPRLATHDGDADAS